MLADAGLALSESREIEEALQKATSIIVPSYADWCTVDLVDGDVIRRAALVHSEQIDAEMAESMRGVVAQRADVNDPVARVIESGEPLFLPAIPDDMSHLGSRSEEYRSAARALRGGSSIGVPLQAGDRTFGVLGMMRVQGREAFDETDLALSRELGRQLGGWVERGRLFSDLRQALSAKDEFFGFVSHELKTPLTTVVGVSDVLSRRYTELEEDQRQDAISLIRRDSLRLEEIIANMLTLARSERQTGDEPALVQHVLGGALSMHRQRHPHREVETRVEAGLPPVLAPAGWIDRVVENLLSNAEKYSDNPTKIEVEAEQVGKLVEVRVLDRGRGISEEQMRDVFEPFFRADPNEPGVSGVGLGLTVCRRLIERLGGEVWLAQREGGGTVAGFRLPVMEIPEE
jgi:signal transduction histidine kinase